MRMLLLTAGILAFIAGGCQVKPEKTSEGEMISGPRVVAVPDDITPAVERVGGLKSWANTQVIAGECTYTVYNSDGTKYVTSQRHGVYPWSDTIQVYDTEPQGRYAWSLFRDNFRMIESPGVRANPLNETIGDRYVIEAIWSILAPPARIASLASEDTKAGEAVLIDGLFYNVIELPGDRIYYLNKTNGIINMCLVPGPKGRYYLARGFEYRPVPDTLISLPKKIEIFNSDKKGTPIKRIIEIDYYRQQTIPF